MAEDDLDVSSTFTATGRNIAAIIVILLIGSLANSAGVGGGAIFIPILQALVGFDLKDATAISQALITAGSIVSVLLNLFKRSPLNPAAPLIDWNIAVVLTPVILAGVAGGVLLNTIFPVWLITILLLLLMILLVLQSSNKAVTMWKLETRAARAQMMLEMDQDARSELSLTHMADAGLHTTSQLIRQASNRTQFNSLSRTPSRRTSMGTRAHTWVRGDITEDALESLASLEGGYARASSHKAGHAALYKAPSLPGAAGASGHLPAPHSDQHGEDYSYDSMEGAPYVPRPIVRPPPIRAPSSSRSGRFAHNTPGTSSVGSPTGLSTPLLIEEEEEGEVLSPRDGQPLSPNQHSGPLDFRFFKAKTTGRRSPVRNNSLWLPNSRLQRIAEHSGVGEVFTATRSHSHRTGVWQEQQDDSSWVTRRSKWRTHLLHGGAELGAVPVQGTSLLSRAQSRRQSNASSANLDTPQTAHRVPGHLAGATVPEEPDEALSSPGSKNQQGGEGKADGEPTSPFARADAQGQGTGTLGGMEGGDVVARVVVPGARPGATWRPRPVQPPLPVHEALDILARLDPHHPSLTKPIKWYLPEIPPLPSSSGTSIDGAAVTAAAIAVLEAHAEGKTGQKPGGDSSNQNLPGRAAVSQSGAVDAHAEAIAKQQLHKTSDHGSSNSSLSRIAPDGSLLKQAQAEIMHADAGVVMWHDNDVHRLEDGAGGGGAAAGVAGDGTRAAAGDVRQTPNSKNRRRASLPVSAMFLVPPPPVTDPSAPTADPPSSTKLPKVQEAPMRLPSDFLRAGSIARTESRLRMEDASKVPAGQVQGDLQAPSDQGLDDEGDVPAPGLSIRQLPTLLKDVVLVMASDLALVPGHTVLAMVGTWIIFSGMQVARTLVERCSPTYWGLLAGQLAFMLGVSVLCVRTFASQTPPLEEEEAPEQQEVPDKVQGGPVCESQDQPQSSEGTSSTDVAVVVVVVENEPSGGGADGCATPAAVRSPFSPSAAQHALGENGADVRSAAPSPGPPEAPEQLLDDGQEVPRSVALLGASPGALAATMTIACIAGLVGGLLGLGGGMLIGPLLLELGTHPQVSAATSSLTVLFSSSAALVGFVVLGRLNVSYSLVLGGVSACASILGVLVVSDLVRRSGRISIVVFSLCIVMMVALLAIATFGIQNMIKSFESGSGAHFGSLCG